MESKNEIFKKLFYEIGKKYYSEIERDFEIDSENADFFKMMSMYFSEDERFEKETCFKLRKGLIVSGKNGVGKTSFFRIVNSIGKIHNYKPAMFKDVSVHKVVSDFNCLGEEYMKKIIKTKYYFDDLGAENIANFYGIKEDLMKRVFLMRYDRFVLQGEKTFVSTNLNRQEIKKRYGERVYDRMLEMFNFIHMPGISRR